MNPDFILLRREREAEKARNFSQSKEPIRHIARGLLRFSGLGAVARRKALALQLERNVLELHQLPADLDGYRVLQISDLHFPEQRDPEWEEAIASLAANTAHELTVLTGDYRDRSVGPFEGALNAMQALRPHLSTRAIAILGNHDSIDMVEPLNDMGYEVLVNRTINIKVGSASFDVLGVDDPSHYRLHDLDACLENSTASHRLLLAHSPDLGITAANAGIDAYFCGHTHGGQLCLPGGYPVYVNTRAPARMVSGAWHEGKMCGYTSRGAGTSLVVARSFCPPEITLHTLR